MEITVNDANFEQEVLQADLPVLVDFWAPWCGPCKVLAPTIAELAGEYAGRLKVCKVNIDDSPSSAVRFGIRSIPTLVIFKAGREAGREIGALPKAALEEKIKAHLE